MTCYRIDRRQLALGFLAALLSPTAVRSILARQAQPATPIEQLALTFIDGNGYTVLNQEAWFQFQAGAHVDDRLAPAVAESILAFSPIDIHATTTSLQNPDEYYQTMVSGRLLTISTVLDAASYVERVLEEIVIPEATADPSIGTDYQTLAVLPDYDEAMSGWTFMAQAGDGGLVPGVRFVAQVGATAVSVTVISQNPATSNGSALALIETQIAAIWADEPVVPGPFPVVA